MNYYTPLWASEYLLLICCNYGFGERAGAGLEEGNQLEHGAVEGAIDLLEGKLPREVHINHEHMAQEPR